LFSRATLYWHHCVISQDIVSIFIQIWSREVQRISVELRRLWQSCALKWTAYDNYVQHRQVYQQSGRDMIEVKPFFRVNYLFYLAWSCRGRNYARRRLRKLTDRWFPDSEAEISFSRSVSASAATWKWPEHRPDYQRSLTILTESTFLRMLG
jgi:hypothetical protein